MKKIYLIPWILFGTVITTWATDIRGRFNGYQNEQILVKVDDKIDTLKVNSNGYFVYQYKVTKPFTEFAFYRFGKEPIMMRLNNQDRVQFEATKDSNGDINVIFRGDRKELNQYLTEYQIRNSHMQWPMNKIAMMSFKEHAAAVDVMEKELNELINRITEEEKQLVPDLRNNLHTKMLVLKQRYCWAIRSIKKEAMDRDTDYVIFVRNLDMNDETWYEKEKEAYLDLVDGRIRWEMAVNNDPRNNTDLHYIAYMEWVRKLVKSNKIANTLINNTIETYFNIGGNIKIDKIYQAYLKYSTDSKSQSKIEAKYKKLTELRPGKLAPDFELKDENGKVYKLSDFKGKNLYIDVWATWCGPCIHEIPYFKKKYQQYKDAKGLKFISISVDSNVAGWKKKLSEDKPEWSQFIVDNGINSDLNKKYGIYGIPQFMLIDKERKIITISAPRPSDPKIDKYLEKYTK